MFSLFQNDKHFLFCVGEADDEVDRVLLFQAAITGYSPLLLEINWNVEITFEKLLNSAHSVIVNIQKDPSLPQRLQEANRLLPWIKGISLKDN